MQTTTTRRRGSDWVRLGHGIRMPSGLAGRDSLLAELAAWQQLLPPSATYTGVTAARVHGLWLPPAAERLPLFAAMGEVQGEYKPLRSRLVISRHPAMPRREPVDGVPIAPPADAMLACARHLSALDLIVMLDSALRLGLCTEGDVLAAAGHRRKGAPALRDALTWADARSESAWESVLRVLHHTLGVAVTPQVEIHDDSGTFVARADLLVEGTRSVHEYDGAQHREARQHRSDLQRERRLGNLGYQRRGYTSDVLLTQAATVQRDCEVALGRPLDPAGLATWHRLVATSLLTPAGEQHVLERVRRVDAR